MIEADKNTRLIIRADASPLTLSIHAEQKPILLHDLRRTCFMHRVQMRGHAGNGARLAFTNKHIVELITDDLPAALNTTLPDVLLQERDHLLFPAGR